MANVNNKSSTSARKIAGLRPH